MKADRKQVADIFVALGFVNAAKWSDEQLIDNVKSKLPVQYAGNKSKLTESQYALAKSIVLSRAKKEPFTLTDDEAAGAKSKPTPKSPAKEDKVKTKNKDKKANKAEKSEKKDKKKIKNKPASSPRGEGVIAYLTELVKGATKNKPLTVDEAIRRVHKKFSDREESSLRNTITSQLSCQLRAKGLPVKKMAERGAGYYWSKNK